MDVLLKWAPWLSCAECVALLAFCAAIILL